MAFDFPTNPVLGQKFVSGPYSYIWNGYGWMNEPPTAYVKVAGDQMTGPLGIRMQGSTGHLTLDNTTATDQIPIVFTKNNLRRWTAGVGPGPEPGGDVNSDWHFRRYNDAGVLFGDIPFKINRKTGRASLAFNPVDPMDVATKQFVEQVMGGGGPEHVLRGGDTMTGPLTLPTLTINAQPGLQADLWGQVGGAARWLIRMTDNFELHKYTDAGAYGGSPFNISRATGNASFSNNVGVTGQMSAGSVWSVTGYLGNFASDSASIGNCTSGGTFSLTTVTCNTLGAASSITSYGVITANGVIFQGSEIQTTRGDGLIVLRGGTGGGLCRINQWGGVVPDFGFICKPGIYAQARQFWFNIDHNPDDNSTHLWIDNTDYGQIVLSSDYRIKKDVLPLPSTWAQVKALKPIKYTQAYYNPSDGVAKADATITPGAIPKAPLFKADDIERWGFIAHELQDTLIDSAATAYKDAPNALQSPNPWTVIAALTKTLQEAMQRIETLEGRLGIST